MIDYVKQLPKHIEKYVGENDLYLEIYNSDENVKPPLLFVHGAYTGGWMWSKYLPHFIEKGFPCYVMNLRSHYKSRNMDLTTIILNDYIEDVLECINECSQSPILIGFSLGGILCQKVAETKKIRGLVTIDSAISKEVNEMVPYASLSKQLTECIEPAPVRNEVKTADESKNDILFQKKYNGMESTKVFNEIGCWMEGVKGISINNKAITCPVLVIKSVDREEKQRRGLAEAKHLDGEYKSFQGMSHTGLLIGIRYKEVVDRIMQWLETIK